MTHIRNGLFFPVVLQDGIASGNWKLHSGRSADVVPFDPSLPLPEAPLAKASRLVATLRRLGE